MAPPASPAPAAPAARPGRRPYAQASGSPASQAAPARRGPSTSGPDQPRHVRLDVVADLVWSVGEVAVARREPVEQATDPAADEPPGDRVRRSFS